MTRFYHIISALLFVFAVFSAGGANAQCGSPGLVVDDNTCGKVLLDFSGSSDFLIPSGNELDSIPHNTEVNFSYELTGETGCSGYSMIAINCLDVSGSCDAGFIHTEYFDVLPTVEFEPVTLDSDLEYYWSFGDQSSSTEMLPDHVYAEQGTYTVCLTLNGANCEGETTCQDLDLFECHAAFSYETLEDGLVQFYDFSEGNYTEWEWKMGDGDVFTNEAVETHTYNGVDIYTVCLTVWNDSGCSSEYCDYVFTGTGDVCAFSDCVLPGDTDVDQAANVYDLLPIGVAYGAEGPPRSLDNQVSFPGLAWEPQYSPDWGLETIAGVDYKHIDCNGDGNINGDDMEAIEQNYIEPGTIFQVTAPGQPYFWLEFDFDTVVVTDDTPAFFTLEADLMAGTPGLPFDDLRGFALQMDYPEDMVLEGGGVTIDYNDNSFFGSSNDILWMGKDRTDVGVMDLGITRKNLFGNGFGKVADVSFIVIGDLVPRSESATPFDINLNGVIAVNEAGAQLTLEQPSGPATVVILNRTTTGTEDELLNQKVNVFPNPAKDNLWVSIGDLHGQRVEVFNALGQRVEEHEIQSSQFQLDMGGLSEGVYFLHIYTDEGVAKKRVVVE